MKTIAVALIAAVCLVGLASAQFGYSPVGTSGGFGQGGLLALIGLLVLLMALFGNNNNSSGTGSTTLIYGNFSGPTGGK